MTTPTKHLVDVRLDKGAHDSFDDGHCLMEVVAWFAGEPHSDAPRCVSPYLRDFGIRLNDRANDERRQQLLRFVPMVTGTAGDGLDEQRRWLAADTVIRTLMPKWLDRAGLTDQASELRALDPITDRARYDAAIPARRAAYDAAWAARRERWNRIREAVRTAVTERAVAAADAAADAVAAAVAVAVAVELAARGCTAAAAGRAGVRMVFDVPAAATTPVAAAVTNTRRTSRRASC